MNCRDDSFSINNLPTELLAKIFSTLTIATRPWQNPLKLPSPALLSSVCSHWRIVAQNTPELWVHIKVPLHKSPEDCRHWTAEWIARSGILPLTVMITVTTDWTGRGIPSHLTDIIGLLSQNSERLRHLALDSRSLSSAIIQRAFSLLQSAPNLQQLTICCEGRASSWFVGNHSQRQYSLNFPRLTILKTEGSMVSPIPNLTSLSVGNLHASYDAISQYFTASPGLQHLALDKLLPLKGPFPHAALIHVDSLRSLAVKLHWTQSPGQESPYIFKYLAMPNIKCLELGGDAWKVSDFGQSLSFAKLDTLRISHRSEQSLTADTINFLHSFSTVRHLQLVHASTQGLLFKSGRRLTRNNSINFRSPSRHTAPTNLNTITAIQQNQSVSTSVWPELRIITLETLEADDVLNLCNFITSHRQVEVVELSTSSRRHLSSSLLRKGDSVYQRPSLFVAAGSQDGLHDVEEWLGKMVDIRTLHSPSVGLMDSADTGGNLQGIWKLMESICI